MVCHTPGMGNNKAISSVGQLRDWRVLRVIFLLVGILCVLLCIYQSLANLEFAAMSAH